MKMLVNVYFKFIKMLERLAIWLCCLAVGLLAIVMTLNVLFRHFIDYSMPWTNEVSLFLFAWVTFLGASLGVHRNDLAAVKIVLDRFSGKMELILKLLIQLLIFTFSVLFSYYALRWLTASSTLNAVATTTSYIKMWIPYLAVPVGMILSAFFSLDSIIKLLINQQDKPSETEPLS